LLARGCDAVADSLLQGPGRLVRRMTGLKQQLFCSAGCLAARPPVARWALEGRRMLGHRWPRRRMVTVVG
jgi:hypothetical protein